MIYQIADENGTLKHIILSVMDTNEEINQIDSGVITLPHGTFCIDPHGDLISVNPASPSGLDASLPPGSHVAQPSVGLMSNRSSTTSLCGANIMASYPQASPAPSMVPMMMTMQPSSIGYEKNGADPMITQSACYPNSQQNHVSRSSHHQYHQHHHITSNIKSTQPSSPAKANRGSNYKQHKANHLSSANDTNRLQQMQHSVYKSNTGSAGHHNSSQRWFPSPVRGRSAKHLASSPASPQTRHQPTVVTTSSPSRQSPASTQAISNTTNSNINSDNNNNSNNHSDNTSNSGNISNSNGNSNNSSFANKRSFSPKQRQKSSDSTIQGSARITATSGVSPVATSKTTSNTNPKPNPDPSLIANNNSGKENNTSPNIHTNTSTSTTSNTVICTGSTISTSTNTNNTPTSTNQKPSPNSTTSQEVKIQANTSSNLQTRPQLAPSNSLKNTSSTNDEDSNLKPPVTTNANKSHGRAQQLPSGSNSASHNHNYIQSHSHNSNDSIGAHRTDNIVANISSKQQPTPSSTTTSSVDNIKQQQAESKSQETTKLAKNGGKSPNRDAPRMSNHSNTETANHQHADHSTSNRVKHVKSKQHHHSNSNNCSNSNSINYNSNHHNHHHANSSSKTTAAAHPVKVSSLVRQSRVKLVDLLGKLVRNSLSSCSDTKFAGVLLVLFTTFAMLLALLIHVYFVAPVTE